MTTSTAKRKAKHKKASKMPTHDPQLSTKYNAPPPSLPVIDLSRFRIESLKPIVIPSKYYLSSIRIICEMLCKDTSSPTGEITSISACRTINRELFDRMPKPERNAFIFKIFQELLEHELAECLYVDGERVRNPHPEELQP